MKSKSKKSKKTTIKKFKPKDPRKSYRNYVKQYRKRKEHLETKYGFEMYSEEYSYRQWKENYIALHNDQIAEKKAGLRKTTGAINQELVSLQSYDLSLKQAKLIQAAMDESGEEVLPLTKIRLGQFKLENIGKTYHELRTDEDISSYEAKNLISWYFFGSE